MVEFNLKEEMKKAESFRCYKTYVFIQTRTNLYNGKILKIGKNEFVFLADGIPSSFPILFTSLKAPIVPSKKERVSK